MSGQRPLSKTSYVTKACSDLLEAATADAGTDCFAQIEAFHRSTQPNIEASQRQSSDVRVQALNPGAQALCQLLDDLLTPGIATRRPKEHPLPTKVRFESSSLATGTDAHLTSLLIACAEKGYFTCVGTLISRFRALVDPTARESAALRLAAENGHAQVVEILLSDGQADPGCQDDEAIGLAAAGGHITTVLLLARDPRVNVLGDDAFALCEAITNGYFEIVRVLLHRATSSELAPFSQRIIGLCLKLDPNGDRSHAIVSIVVGQVLSQPLSDEVLCQFLSRASQNENADYLKIMLDTRERNERRLPPQVLRQVLFSAASCTAQQSPETFMMLLKLLLEPVIVSNDIAGLSNEPEVATEKQSKVDTNTQQVVFCTNLAKSLCEKPSATPVVDYLIRSCGALAHADDNSMLERACAAGNLSCVKMLLSPRFSTDLFSRVDPSARENYCIREASAEGHTKVVVYLLQQPEVDPCADNDASLVRAASGGHGGVVRALLEDSRVDPSSLKALLCANEVGADYVVHMIFNARWTQRRAMMATQLPRRSYNGTRTMKHLRTTRSTIWLGLLENFLGDWNRRSVEMLFLVVWRRVGPNILCRLADVFRTVALEWSAYWFD
jgi:hypothetical protein